jgi:phosphotransacetylase
LIGRPAIIAQRVEKFGLRLREGVDYDVVNVEQDHRYRDFWQTYHRMTERKGVTVQMAKIEMRRRLTLIGAMLLHKGDVDGMICGTWGTTAMHLHYIDQVIGKRNGGSPSTPQDVRIYACMNGLMLPGRQVFLVDTHVNYDPTPEELTEITVMAAEEMMRFGLKPKAALLSHSNFGSSNQPSALKMRQTLEMLRASRRRGWKWMAKCMAMWRWTARRAALMMPNSTLSGDANLLVLPNIDAANISPTTCSKLQQVAISPSARCCWGLPSRCTCADAQHHGTAYCQYDSFDRSRCQCPNIVQSIRAFRVQDLQDAASSLGQHFLYANLANAQSKQDVLDMIAQQFTLPAHFGKNFDALYDCMTDPVHKSGPQPGFHRGAGADSGQRQVRQGSARAAARHLPRHGRHVFVHWHFFGAALHVEVPAKAPAFQPAAQRVAQQLAALAEGHLHQLAPAAPTSTAGGCGAAPCAPRRCPRAAAGQSSRAARTARSPWRSATAASPTGGRSRWWRARHHAVDHFLLQHEVLVFITSTCSSRWNRMGVEML